MAPKLAREMGLALHVVVVEQARYRLSGVRVILAGCADPFAGQRRG